MIRLRVPGQLNYRDVAIRMVAAACQLVREPNAARRARLERGNIDRRGSLDLSNPFDAMVVSAFSEVFNNVVLHGYSEGQEGDIEIDIEPAVDELVIRVRDVGRTFNIDEVPVPDLDALPEGGMGVFICRQLLDELDYQPGPPNVWTLRKSFTKQRLVDLPVAGRASTK